MHTMQQTANTLPPEAVAMLKKAASTPNTGVGCLNRLIAIEEAAQKIRRLWPKYFKERQ